MLKKMLLAITAMLFLTGAALAGAVDRTIIDDETLNNTAMSATSTTVYIQENDRTAFFVETDVSGSVINTISAQVSYDETNWLATNIYDNTGGATAQTGEMITSDGWYYFWLTPDLLTKYVRILATCTGCTAASTLDTSVYEIADR